MKKLGFGIAMLVLLALFGSATAAAQRAPLPLGTVQGNKQLVSCPTGFFAG
jgi:hypothetical protein